MFRKEGREGCGVNKPTVIIMIMTKELKEREKEGKVGSYI